ncbi:MAG: hypothetical protein ACXABF_16215 [Candidatus Thorarchaeota archaeon]|jgi:hypothetical protein
MLTGYKTYIGIATWTVGAICSNWLGLPEVGEHLIGIGKLIAGGGLVAKLNRIVGK